MKPSGYDELNVLGWIEGTHQDLVNHRDAEQDLSLLLFLKLNHFSHFDSFLSLIK